MATFPVEPPLQCDIVMKGGITSGVVYPGAAARLAERYRFRSIGGTSAGAIAAAIVAAAEHRRRNGDAQGFEALAGLDEELAGPEGGQPLLLRLFQPDPGTRPLFSLMLGVMKHRWLAPWWLVKAFPLFPVLGLLCAAACIALGAAAGLPAGWAAAGVVAGLVLALVGAVTEVVKAVFALSGNGFGLCTLGPDSVGSTPALTEWMHERIQTLAGLDADGAPLTFADLWGVTETEPAARHHALVACSREPERRAVDLQVMTTDLTHGRPWRLPAPFRRYAPNLEFGGELLYRPDELSRYFPPSVMEHLEHCVEPISPKRARHLPDGGAGFRRFPIGPDLPVLVATRMSLSFPGLIAAVPLWRLRYTSPEHAQVERVVFSDGGITSNFPVHFFDAPLPRRPTFGLHLTTFPKGEKPPRGTGAQASAVVPPASPSQPAPQQPREIASLGQFFAAIKDAMQNWRDNTQAEQPGFRDRMVHIRLGEGEGGLTLTMDRDKVLDLSARGGEAAKVLVDLFAAPGDGPGTRWNEHRFVRFRIATATTEQMLAAFARTYHADAPTDGISMPYPQRVSQGWPGGVGPYRYASKDQMRRALAAADLYNLPLPDVITREQGYKAPRPTSVLRIMPPT